MSLTVQVVYEGQAVTHWMVSRGKKGGQPVTVRRSDAWPRIYVCLTDHKTDCIHVKAVRAFEHDYVGPSPAGVVSQEPSIPTIPDGGSPPTTEDAA